MSRESALDTLENSVKQLNAMLWPESWNWQLRGAFTGAVLGSTLWCLVFLIAVMLW